MPDLLDIVRTRLALSPGVRLSVSRAAALLGTTPRALRYRETVGLLPARVAGTHRLYGPRELLAAAYADELEHRYGVTPAALAFGLRVLTDATVAADLRDLGALTHRIASSPRDALDWEADKARRLLHLGQPR